MSLVLEGSFADREAWIPERCPVAKALEVIGARSTILLLREAYFGTHRFDAFVRRVRITEAVAATQLRRLVETGLLRKEPYREPGQRTRYEYHLTQMGRDLMPAIVALMQWGDAYLQGDLGPAVDLRHLGCGEVVEAEVRCGAGHQVGPDEIVMRPAGTSDPSPCASGDPAPAESAAPARSAKQAESTAPARSAKQAESAAPAASAAQAG